MRRASAWLLAALGGPLAAVGCNGILGINELAATEGGADARAEATVDSGKPDGDGGPCANACTAPATQCGGGGVQQCQPQSNGCTAWVTTVPCSGGLVCERYGTPTCADPNWAEWPAPNSGPDVEAGAPNLEAYVDNKDGTVTDSVTKLMWQQDAPATLALADAISYCQTLPLGGYGDWRLASLPELLSLVDYGQQNPCINTTLFPTTAAGHFWTSTPVAGGGTTVGWDVSFTLGGFVSANPANNTNSVRCVR